jgi:hypothetical protein
VVGAWLCAASALRYFAGATGDFNNIGAGDLSTSRTIFRYSGQVCFAVSDY